MQSIATECGSAPSLRAESLDKGHNEVSWDIVEVSPLFFVANMDFMSLDGDIDGWCVHRSG